MIKKRFKLAVFALFFATFQLFGSPGYPQEKGLEGLYRLIQDSDRKKPLESRGDKVILVITEEGQFHLHSLTNHKIEEHYGNYAVSGSQVSIKIPDLKIAVKGSYQISGSKLYLPLKVLSKGRGNSEWEKDKPVSYPAADALLRYQKARSDGFPDSEASRLAGEEAKKDPFVKEVAADPAQGVFTIIYVSGNKDHVILNPGWTISKASPIDVKPHPLAGDPRVHLEQTRKEGPDDPKNYYGILFAPFHSRHIAFYQGDPISEARGKFIEQDWTFEEAGENLYSLVESLERAHYFGHTYFDDEVTPFSILKELIQNPGVIYFGAHGNVDVLTTGVVIENTFTRGDIARHFRNAPEGMCLDSSLHPTSCVKLLDQKLEDDLNAKRKEFINEVKNKLGSKVSAAQAAEMAKHFERAFFASDHGYGAFVLAVNPGFFTEMRKTHLTDLSQSWVTLLTCHSMEHAPKTGESFPQAFHAKAVLGFKSEIDVRAGSAMIQYLFRLLTRPTFSLREAWTHLGRVVKGKAAIWKEEIEILTGSFSGEDDPPGTAGLALISFLDSKSYKQMVILGDDLKPYKPIKNMWLIFLHRWNRDPDAGSESLQNCENQFWSQKTGGGLASPFCNSGVEGNHIPTKEEVEETAQLIAGSPRPIPGGRFTFHDKPVAKKTK